MGANLSYYKIIKKKQESIYFETFHNSNESLVLLDIEGHFKEVNEQVLQCNNINSPDKLKEHTVLSLSKREQPMFEMDSKPTIDFLIQKISKEKNIRFIWTTNTVIGKEVWLDCWATLLRIGKEPMIQVVFRNLNRSPTKGQMEQMRSDFAKHILFRNDKERELMKIVYPSLNKQPKRKSNKQPINPKKLQKSESQKISNFNGNDMANTSISFSQRRQISSSVPILMNTLNPNFEKKIDKTHNVQSSPGEQNYKVPFQHFEEFDNKVFKLILETKYELNQNPEDGNQNVIELLSNLQVIFARVLQEKQDICGNMIRQLNIEEKEFRFKYKQLEEHLQRGLNSLENEKDTKKTLIDSNISLKKYHNRLVGLLQEQKEVTQMIDSIRSSFVEWDL
ncbi:hypothetical protein M0811_14598 [Anaeramoeba ignava]|uniref:Uncharacterized protein n=1 Tax=Anaeramoeba ignava TaxID=1746090 RepID=A0A9Q0RGE0_ANAIG|nr:hypothetical protein M0811_14598 [Anaeramoeba ignava]